MSASFTASVNTGLSYTDAFGTKHSSSTDPFGNIKHVRETPVGGSVIHVEEETKNIFGDTIRKECWKKLDEAEARKTIEAERRERADLCNAELARQALTLATKASPLPPVWFNVIGLQTEWKQPDALSAYKSQIVQCRDIDELIDVENDVFEDEFTGDSPLYELAWRMYDNLRTLRDVIEGVAR